MVHSDAYNAASRMWGETAEVEMRLAGGFTVSKSTSQRAVACTLLDGRDLAIAMLRAAYPVGGER